MPDLDKTTMACAARDFPWHPLSKGEAPPEWALAYMEPGSSLCLQLDTANDMAIVGWRFHTKAELDACLKDHSDLPVRRF